MTDSRANREPDDPDAPAPAPYAPRPGDRVRRTETHEGTVREIRRGTVVYADGSVDALVPRADRPVSWERLEEPEPDWRPGDFALAAGGSPAQELAARHEWQSARGGWHAHADLQRPLRRLVPE